MMSGVKLNSVNHLVLRKQHMTDDSRTDDIVQIVKDTVGLHATNPKGPYLSLFARTRNFKREYLDGQLYVKRNLGKIRCMRGTLHVLTKEMIPIAYVATRRMVEKTSKRYAEFREVPYEEYEAVSKLILEILKGREMTTSEIKETLKIQLDVSAILYLMCDQGLLIRSKPRKYALFNEYFPDLDLTKMSEIEAITMLVQQYLGSYGPVTENDIAWWTGLTRTKVREALNNIQNRLVRIKISNLKGDFILSHQDEKFIKNTSPTEKRTVNLLPSLDPYLMGYKERDRYLDHEHYDKVFDRSGNATSTILLDGRVVGVWDFAEDAEPLVKLFLFKEVGERVLKNIHSKGKMIGKFIAKRDVKIRECDSMVPLTRRTAGGVMSPLKGC